MCLDAVKAYDGRHAEGNPFNAVFAVHHGGNRQDRLLISYNTFADPFYGHGDTVVSRPFLGDNS